MNLATHIEERLYTFGGPFAMFDDFTDKERDLSVLMMEQWGKFIKQQTVDWGQHPHHAYFDLNGLTEVENEAHSHRFAPNIAFQNLIINDFSSSVWLDLIKKQNERQNCKSFIQCPYPGFQV